jgi:class 3 adenylate cyclase/tetratricopeptide (TPR) repeat protein
VDVIACEACGRESPEGAAFCASCGAQLSPPAGGLLEERKVVTILFADLVGSTAQAERRDPEDVRATLNAYYARLRTELERHGGTVEKFIGDAVMAVFGAPVAHEDDPERAVRAALAIRDVLAETEVDVRVAVHTGEALVSRGAKVAAGEAMVAGDVVNTAARLQTAAPVNGVLVGETTYRATVHTIDYRPVDPVQARGKSEPIPAWEAIDAKARFGVDVVLESPTELVGREDEVALLSSALARMRREREPQLVTLVGVPGIGKTRLVIELLTQTDALPDLITWRQGRCLPYGEGVSFWALGEMAKAQAGILETDAAEVAEKKLAEAVVTLVPDDAEAEWVLGHMRPLIGLSTVAGVDDRRSDVFAAWRRFFEGLAEQRPAVLVVEDLHWADEGLLDFVDYLVDWARGVPLLVVASARPELLERRPGWGGGKANATTVSLRPLSELETARLLALLLEQPLLSADTQHDLVARAGGNPLYAEEYVRMLRDGRFTGERLPETVQGIIAARLDALPPKEKLLVQDAAVVGKVFWSGTLAAIGGETGRAIEERLHALERKEFIRRERRSSVANESAYAFRHVLVRDVAYTQIPRAGRADKHRVTAEWIESLDASRAEDRAEMLAHHYAAALEFARASSQRTDELEARARLAFRDAGERALALSAIPTALHFFTNALELWPEDDDAWPSLVLRQAQADMSIRQRGEQPLVPRALERMLSRGDVENAAEAELLLADCDWFAGRNDSTFSRLDHARALVADRPSSPSKAKTYAELSRFLMVGGRYDEAVEIGQEGLVLAQELGLRELQSNALNSIGSTRAILGDAGGFADLEEARVIAEAINSPEAPRALANHASIMGDSGELARARELWEQTVDLTGRFGMSGFVLWCEIELTYHDYLGGSWASAFAGAEAFLADVGEVHYMQAVAGQVQAEIMLGRGETERAVAESDRALAFARSAKDPQNLYPALAIHAHLLTLAGRSTEASGLADELMKLVTEREYLGNRWATALAFTLDELGRPRDASALLMQLANPTLWRKAALAYVEGDRVGAADVLGEMGNHTDEAYARLRAAEEGAGAEQRDRALAFYRGVGATAHVRRVEALLPASA